MANKFFRPFLWVVIGCGSLVFLYSATQVRFAQFDSRFVVLVAVALLLTSMVTIPLPRLSSQISVSDTFVFLVLLIHGASAAVIVAALEAFLSSLHFSRRRTTVAFNWASAAVSILITATVLELIIGNIVVVAANPLSATFLGVVLTMALTHYISNSGLVAIEA